MIHGILTFLGAIAIAIGCSSHVSAATPPVSECRKEVTLVFHADPSFTDVEFAEIHQATDEWFTFSGGRVNVAVVRDVAGQNEPKMLRVYPDSAEVLEVERAQRSYVIGWMTGEPPTIRLVVNRILTSQIHLLVEHELGHAVGLRWPECRSDERDCKHSPDNFALMAPVFNGNRFTKSDLEFCRASCLCP